jgi:hypothetical protein
VSFVYLTSPLICGGDKHSFRSSGLSLVCLWEEVRGPGSLPPLSSLWEETNTILHLLVSRGERLCTYYCI